jgi:hypothetical protein
MTIDEFADYRPQGLCAACGEHQATEWFGVYRRTPQGVLYEARCACCVALGKLERAHAIAARIPDLEKAALAARATCNH